MVRIPDEDEREDYRREAALERHARTPAGRVVLALNPCPKCGNFTLRCTQFYAKTTIDPEATAGVCDTEACSYEWG